MTGTPLRFLQGSQPTPSKEMSTQTLPAEQSSTLSSDPKSPASTEQPHSLMDNSKKASRALVRKIDFKLLPFLSLLYL